MAVYLEWLRRAGIVFTLAEKAAVLTLAEDGKIVEAHQRILQVLEKQLGSTKASE